MSPAMNGPLMPKRYDREFLQLTQAGGERDRDPPKRWHIGSSQFVDNSLRAKFEPGGEVQQWPKVEFDEEERAVNFPEVTEDMPWSWPYVPQVVSLRLRRFIEQIAPGEAQFLPITIRQKHGKTFDNGEYWCVHWKHVIDCIDWSKSRYITQKDHQGTEYRQFAFMGIVIDPSKIDSKVHFCRPLWNSLYVVLIRSSTAKLMRKEKFSGPQFDHILLTTDPDHEVKKFAEPFAALKDWKELR